VYIKFAASAGTEFPACSLDIVVWMEGICRRRFADR